MKKYLTIFLCILSVSITYSAERYGGFLQEKTNTRATGMGDAFIAVADKEGFEYNPAGLAFSDKTLLQFDKESGYNSMSNAEVVLPLTAGKGLAIGFSHIKLSVDDIAKWQDENTQLGTFSSEESANIFGIGLQYEKNLGVGVLVKLMNQSLDNAKADGYTVDLGMLYNHKDYMYLAMVLTNIKGDGLKWNTARGTIDELPSTLKLGGALRLFKDNFISSIQYENELGLKKRSSLKFGEEVWIKDRLALRIGSNSGKLTAGLGIKLINLIGIDYSYSKEDLGNVNRVSLNIKF
ncbi:PorV/PorQ family protein [Haliovirga abyssi]|uniref:PorV/PorQ family protein n=1 Tax=Haliovirga abyssi TaxID=2996794 RepID=A0AAU9DDT9_9FUSO|nr:PorV/PorQ family protein [Haliovirga abyssi]BDU50507.1 hypothetical protein HLVA_10760 [Haliovirga abyssi]